MTATQERISTVSIEYGWARNIRALAYATGVTPAALLHSVAQILFERYKGVDSAFDPNQPVNFRDVLTSPNLIFKDLPSIRVEWRDETAGLPDSLYLLQVTETPAGAVDLSWRYPELSSEDHLLSNKLIEHFRILLAGLVTYAEQPVCSIPFLTTEEMEQIVQWNTTATDYPRDALIHELFEQQCLETPTAIAITCGTDSVTYGEANAQANQLAHHLIERGVGHESVVGIALERSIEMVVSMIAVLKAGGCYLPLDATYPHERLRFMVQDSGTEILITQGELRRAFEGLALETVDIDGDRDKLAGYPVRDVMRPESVSADSLSYVMYTSGSTGLPKGVEVVHRGVVRLVKNTNYIHLDRTETMAQISKFSFDAITFEVWGALLNGGRLAILPHDVILSPAKLADAIREHHVTSMFLTAALFNMVAKVKPDAFGGVRNLLAGGDVVSPESACRILDTAPPGRLINGYGPTECTTFSCCHHITSVSTGRSGIPIGGPISNSEAYVLDKSLLPVPVGVIGEIYLGGDGLARGYRNRPELTAERFIPHCIRPETGARLYKTGDRGRYRSDGAIEFVGRTDNQVKLRGHRIELGEIEAALCKHPEVAASVVLTITRENGEPFLYGYVEKRSERDLKAEELRRFLADALPAFMIPSRIAVLEAFPLTHVGKIDRNALQSLRPEHQENITALPKSEIEKQIADAWSRVLAISEVGLDENFFDAGGSSLLMAVLEADLRKNLKVDLTITDLFQYPTVRSLGAFVARKADRDDSLSEVRQRAQRQKQLFQKLRKQSVL
jgi:amino acid adenylation domain-containing protein